MKPFPLLVGSLLALSLASTPAALAAEAKTKVRPAKTKVRPAKAPQMQPVVPTAEVLAPAPARETKGNALFSDSWGLPLHLDVNVHGAYSNVGVETGFTKPTLVQFGAGLTAGFRFTQFGGFLAPFVAGVRSDFRASKQYSAAASSGANYRGSRFNLVSPMVGYRLGDFFFSADFQFLGDYKLANAYTTIVGTHEVAYSGPKGFRITADYRLPFFRPLRTGLMFEYLRFSTWGGGGLVQRDLAEAKKFITMGLNVALDI